MRSRNVDPLVEEATTPWRPRSPEGAVHSHPAWSDLSAPDRERLFEETLLARAIESALDPESLTGTARAVLSRISKRI